MKKKFPSGIATGSLVEEIFQYAKEENFALPAVNVIGNNTINAVLETAKKVNSPIIIQFSYGGALFIAGKSLNDNNEKAAILGSICGAKHVHEISKYYNIPVILHTDHCNKKLLPWINGLLNINEIYYKFFGKTLFSSHMIDLSEEPLIENIKLSKKYFKRMKKLNLTLEVELGITGGEEDGKDNTKLNDSKFYTNPKDVIRFYNELKTINSKFIIAASFGNVHGVYKEKLKLKPEILKKSQDFLKKKNNSLKEKNPINFVFHGGSGASLKEIKKAINYGVIKMNLDTDIQYSFTNGVKKYIISNLEFLKKQIGNPHGKNISNKKYYDPRIWLRKGEENLKKRLIKSFEDLNNINRL
ncbi:class II fructose-bisphosphate aldolase [Candidatus Karelsulcia muelleri]|uniref:class II fructose-bisphosphate aldolase n=1 Tax=Candidatus Karelsulcia muelleri TaxID=336810 RepID=UPI000D7C22B3|nr:class II fructose-bisphosphate aldolase [Candidatus Karelsulcia muelleri]